MSGWNCCSVRVWHMQQLSPFSHLKNFINLTFFTPTPAWELKSKFSHLARILPVFSNFFDERAGSWAVFELFRISATIFWIVKMGTGVPLAAQTSWPLAKICLIKRQNKFSIIPLKWKKMKSCPKRNQRPLRTLIRVTQKRWAWKFPYQLKLTVLEYLK